MKRTLFIFLFIGSLLNVSAALVQQNLCYADSLESVSNPGCGFYRTQGCHFTTSGNKAVNSWGNIAHLRMDISEFSDKAMLRIEEGTNDTVWGVSQPLTQDALDAFAMTLENVRTRGAMAVVRFSYDPWFAGKAKSDPEQEVILGHLKQIAEVYAQYTDVILFVELGMYGSWGEMHSSNVGSNKNIAEALQTLLVATPPEIKIGVRRPDIIAWWLGVNDESNYSGFDIHSDLFQQKALAKGDTMYRVGMYNDGYLGSNSDLGTIGMGSSGHQLTREMMVSWLEKYSINTPYGGELVANYNGDHPINTPTYLSQEGFRTHTSYLNYEWHQPTILSWKDSIFHGEDGEYYGKSGYTYVENHLGYRYILRDAYVQDTVFNNVLNLRLKVQNVGFGNLTSEKKLTFVLKSEGQVFELPSEDPISAMKWFSKDTNIVETNLVLPSDLMDDEYEVYLRLSEYGNMDSDKNYHCIQFGNPSSQYDKTMGANKVGKFTLNRSVSTSATIVPSAIIAYTIEDGVLHLDAGTSVTIYSCDGRLLYKTDDETNIDLKSFKENLFLVTLVRGCDRYVFKLMKDF